MDPSKLQSDSANDVHSLEGTDTVVENEKNHSTSNTSDATGASKGADTNTYDATHGVAPIASARPPLLKRLWQRFNIYLLLFVLIILIAVSVTIVFFVKNRSTNIANTNSISSQNLSDSALKQLSNTNVNVGNSSQVLNVESNAVFAGSVLVRNNVEVAGNIKLAGNLELPGITVSGNSRFSQLAANDVAINGTATVQGVFIAKKGLDVTGNASITGTLTASQVATSALQLNGDLILTHHITAGGPVPGLSRGAALGNGGTASVSGSDTAGSITINIGSLPAAGCFATISFTSRFTTVPHVSVTPIGSGAAGLQYYINRSTSDFSVCTINPAAASTTFGFDYIILN
ncbi:MAG TPA: polymer-forming cytoskeletal protein [Candidatus Saccharimonadales bacterium]